MLDKLALCALAPCLLATGSIAQSFNIDFDGTFVVPPDYAGFVGPAGPWNAVQVQPVHKTLTTVGGVLDNSTAWFTGAGPGRCPESILGLTPGDDEYPLFRDLASGSESASFHVDQLEAGEYYAVLYSWCGDAATSFTLTPTGGSPQTEMTSPSPSPLGELMSGDNLVQFQFTIPPGGGSITIDFAPVSGAGKGVSVFNGLQLVRSIGTQGCPQPDNSIMTDPAIVASGTSDPTGTGVLASANDLQLSLGLLPTSTAPGGGTILCFVSNNNSQVLPQACPAVGERCIGPPQWRVYYPGTMTASQISAGGSFHLPVDLIALGAEGVDVSPGATLHFQMAYRDDPNPGECPGSQTVVRWTQSLSVQLF